MESSARFVVCIENGDYPVSLELHKIYRALRDDEAEADGEFRVVDESGEDYLYPSRLFAEIELPKSVQQAIMGADASTNG